MAEPSLSTKEEVEIDPEAPLLGKRKLSLSSEPGLEIPKGGSSPKTPKPLKKVKKEEAPKQMSVEKELAKTPVKPKLKSSADPKTKKAVKSAKKAPRTPKQTFRKRELLQSV